MGVLVTNPLIKGKSKVVIGEIDGEVTIEEEEEEEEQGGYML